MRKTTALVLAVAAAVALPARGADAPAAPSQEAIATARAMMPREAFDQSMSSSVQGMVKELQAQAQAKGVKLPNDVDRGARNILEKALSYDEVVKKQAGVLSSRFDKTELKRIRDFFDSPTGKKFQASTSAMGEELQSWMMTRYQEVGPELEAFAKKSLESGTPQGPGAGAAPPATGGAKAAPPGPSPATPEKTAK
jgi:hypothetical protein